MASLGAIVKYPDELLPLVKLKMAVRGAEKQIPSEPHLAFCYSMLHKFSRSLAIVIPQLGTDLRNAVMAIGTLALCYNNIELFRGVVKMRRGLTAKVIDRTKTMADVYGAFFDFACMLNSKVDINDPNAIKTLSRLEAIKKICRESGLLSKWNAYILRNEPRYSSTMILILVIIFILPLIVAYHSVNRQDN